ncbi:MAG: thioredoxin family protein [Muribaculaceae bacterium]|nr:thioredoxin family protein [Muribaculaceae bacterium]MDE6329445.1 thioredoxin family protein [Muribaculaceae bacterium]
MKTFEEVIKSATPSLVVFIHSGEQDDKEVVDVVEEVRRKYDGRLNVLRVDESYDQRVAAPFSVSRYPTFVLMKEGEELMRESGKKSLSELSEMIERAF